MFYIDNELKEKYHKEFAESFIAKGWGEEGETTEDIINILNKYGEDQKFIVTDKKFGMARAKNNNGNVFLSPKDIENKKVLFHEIFHTLVDNDNRNGLSILGFKENFSDFENKGRAANEGAIECLVSKMLGLEYPVEIGGDSDASNSYSIYTRIMEQIDFFVGSKCLVRAMRFDPKILNEKFDQIVKKEGAFASITDILDDIETIQKEIDSRIIEYEEAEEKGDHSHMQSISQEVLFDEQVQEKCFQVAQNTIIDNCFTKKIENCDTQAQLDTIMKDIDRFISLGLADNSKSVNYLKALLTNYYKRRNETFSKTIRDNIGDIRQDEFNTISHNMKEDYTIKQTNTLQPKEEKE